MTRKQYEIKLKEQVNDLYVLKIAKLKIEIDNINYTIKEKELEIENGNNNDYTIANLEMEIYLAKERIKIRTNSINKLEERILGE